MKQKRATKDFFSQLPLEAADDPKLFPLKSNCKTIKDSELKGIPWFNFIMFLSFRNSAYTQNCHATKHSFSNFEKYKTD